MTTNDPGTLQPSLASGYNRLYAQDAFYEGEPSAFSLGDASTFHQALVPSVIFGTSMSLGFGRRVRHRIWQTRTP
ncbi:MAG: hypothetical protein ACK5QW_09835 [Cyanobacteriota bacterium]|jgi:hypothetical protein